MPRGMGATRNGWPQNVCPREWAPKRPREWKSPLIIVKSTLYDNVVGRSPHPAGPIKRIVHLEARPKSQFRRSGRQNRSVIFDPKTSRQTSAGILMRSSFYRQLLYRLFGHASSD